MSHRPDARAGRLPTPVQGSSGVGTQALGRGRFPGLRGL